VGEDPGILSAVYGAGHFGLSRRGARLTVYQTAELAFFPIPRFIPFPVRSALSLRRRCQAPWVQCRSGGVRLPLPATCHRLPRCRHRPCRAHSPASMACREPGPGPLGARSQRPHNEERGEPSVPAHRFHGPTDPPCPTRASDGLDQARVIVLDVANSRAHWPACHFLGRIGCEQGFGLGSVGRASQTGHISGHSWCSPKFARCVCSDLRDA
jgi:hypothetical protein